MKVLLKIGSYEFLLPDDKGVQTVLKTLSRGVVVDYRGYDDPPTIEPYEEAMQPSISMRYLKGEHRIIRKKPRRSEPSTLRLEDSGTIHL